MFVSHHSPGAGLVSMADAAEATLRLRATPGRAASVFCRRSQRSTIMPRSWVGQRGQWRVCMAGEMEGSSGDGCAEA